LRHRIRDLRPQVLVYLAAPRGRLRAWRDVLFFRCCGIRRLIGVPHTRDLAQVRRLDDDSYEYEGARLARCVAALGDARLDDLASFDLALTDEETAAAHAALAGLGDGRRLIAASVGAKVDVKDWGDANWAALLRALRAARPGWGLVMMGSVDEWERSGRLLEHWGGDAINLCGRLSVRESAAMLARCRLFIGHDSGPMHLAAAVKTTCVAIFSSRNLPGEWFPQGMGHRVLYRQMDCQGCRLVICEDRAKACIQSITVDEVLANVESAIEAAC
jgi:heptosyltransferase-3